MQLTRVDTMLLGAVDLRNEVRSLFALVMELGIDYPHAYFRVRELERHGELRVESDPTRRGQPLVLSRPPGAARQLPFGVPLQGCNGTLERSDA